MNIYKDLEDSLFRFVSLLFPDWRIIFPYQNGPEPQTPYLVVDVKRLDAVGREQRSGLVSLDALEENGTTTVTQTYQAKVRFELVGKNDTNTTAGDMIHDLEINLRTPKSFELQHINNISLMKYNPVERLPLRRETDVYMFYQLDTEFAYAVQLVEEAEWIVGVGITGVYNDAGREPDYKITSTIEI